MRRLLVLMLTMVAAGFPQGVAARSQHPDNRVVGFKHSGAWEIWCIEQGDTKEVVCDLNLVVNYNPHPDFRAMIPRVYVHGPDGYLIEFEYERQTSFRGAYLESASGRRYDLSGCGRPCLLGGSEAAAFVSFLGGSRRITIHFTDYVVQDFNVEIELDGFRPGLQLLRRMQSEYP